MTTNTPTPLPDINPAGTMLPTEEQKQSDLRSQLQNLLATEDGKEFLRRNLGVEKKAASTYAKPALRPPTTFSGELLIAGNPGKGEMNAEEWCEQMEAYMKLSNIAESDMVTFARTYLTGAALSFLKMHLSNPVAAIGTGQWRVFKQALIKQFQPLNTGQYVRDQLRRLRQGMRSVGEYVADFTRLASQVPTMSKEEQLGYFRGGIRPTLRTAVDLKIGERGSEPSIEEAAYVAAKYEATWNQAISDKMKGNAASASGNTSSTNANKSTMHALHTSMTDYSANPFDALANNEAYDENEKSEEDRIQQQLNGQLNALTFSAKTGTAPSNSSQSHAAGGGPAAIGPCYICNKYGHLQRDCWYAPGASRGSSGRGRGRGGSRGSGRGGRGRGRGRGGGSCNFASSGSGKNQGKDDAHSNE
jgi:hypothetical protein